MDAFAADSTINSQIKLISIAEVTLFRDVAAIHE